MLPTPEHEALRETTIRAVAEHINPFVDQWEEEQIFPAKQVFRALGKLGLLGINKPTEFGGMGLDYSFQAVFNEAAGTINAGGVRMGLGVQTSWGSRST